MLKLKDDIDFKKLMKYGLKPKYDEDTGKIVKYILNGKSEVYSNEIILAIKKLLITNNYATILDNRVIWKIEIALGLTNNIADEALDTIYEMIKDGIIEKYL